MIGFARHEPVNAAIGLCESCRHARRIESSRGTVFYLCLRSATDPSFAKYPRLPVVACTGYELSAREEPPPDVRQVSGPA